MRERVMAPEMMDREMETRESMADREMPAEDLKVLSLLWRPQRLLPADRNLFG